MKHIFVDFEMNSVAKKYKEEQKQCGKEIIEIGAVILNEEFQEISHFKKLVKPQYNSVIDSRYEDLTGIDMKMLSGAEHFDRAFQEFIDWLPQADYKIFAWSNSDLLQIEREMSLKQFPRTKAVKYMLENWLDFQKEFVELIQADHAIALEDALNLCGIAFSGKKHDALHDARNTGRLYQETRTSNVAEHIKMIEEKVGSEPMMITLGDLFRFEELEG